MRPLLCHSQIWLNEKDLKRVGRISFTPAPPQNIWLPPTRDRSFAIAPESGLDCWPGQLAPASTPGQQTGFYKEKEKKKLNYECAEYHHLGTYIFKVA